MGASATRVAAPDAEYKVGEVRSLEARGGPSTRSEYIPMPQGHKLHHPTRQAEDSLELIILRNRYKMQTGNSRDVREATQWAVDNNAPGFLHEQATDRRVKFLM